MVVLHKKQLIGQAITYCLNQLDDLSHFLLDGRLEIAGKAILFEFALFLGNAVAHPGSA